MSMNDDYKIYGAILGTALAVFGLRELSSAIYHSPHPEKEGFLIEVAEATEGGDHGGEAVADKPLAELLKTAVLAEGQKTAKACGACHSFNKGDANKVGPNLWDVVERKHGSHAGYQYSEAMAAKSAEPWTYEALDAFLTSPKAAVPGTKMTYSGIKSAAKRADLLAYLQSLSDAPKPFPAP